MTPNDLIVQAKSQNLSCERYYEKTQREIKTQTAYNERLIVKIMDCIVRVMTCNTYSLKYQVLDAKEVTQAFTQYQSQALEGLRKQIQPKLKKELIQEREFKALERQSRALNKLQPLLQPRVAQKVTQMREAKAVRAQSFQNIQKELNTETPEMRKRSLLNEETEVAGGHGEWIVTRNNGLAFEQIDIETYGQVLQLFKKYHPVKWALEQDPALFPQRVDRLRAEVKLIDDSLELTFIPRILYELTFLKECMKEDLAKENAFPYKDSRNPTHEELEKLGSLCSFDKNSWIKDRYLLEGRVIDASQSKEFLELAHKLNGVFCRIINANLKNRSNFSYGQLKNLLEKQLHFFHEIHEDTHSKLYHRVYRMYSCDGQISTNFSKEDTRGANLPMGIEKEENADILRKALPLECAEGKIVLYRGTPTFVGDKAKGHSKSYGAGIFSGCINDQTAAAFYYMRKKEQCAYALVLDAKDLPKKIFFIPSEHALIQLFGFGEYFHGRSMIGLRGKNKHVGIDGINRKPPYAKIPAFLKSDLEENQHSILYSEYKERRCVILKTEPIGC